MQTVYIAHGTEGVKSKGNFVFAIFQANVSTKYFRFKIEKKNLF